MKFTQFFNDCVNFRFMNENERNKPHDSFGITVCAATVPKKFFLTAWYDTVNLTGSHQMSKEDA